MMLSVSGAFAAVYAPVSAVAAVGGDKLAIIKGIVRDAAGTPIADASVAIFRGGTSKLLKQVTSGRDGSFLARIVPGSYTLLAVAQGFNPVTVLGVEVGRAAELTYGFELERAGGGNTLPEKRLDRNSSKWRIRAAQSARSIYQNREGEDPTKARADVNESNSPAAAEPRAGQTVVETYAAEGDRGSYKGVNIATLLPVGDDGDIVVAAQVATGQGPLRLETGFRLNPFEGHQVRLNASAARLGTVEVANSEKALGQLSFQALDEWRVSGGVILVFGLDYSRFFGAGDDHSLSPRLGLQYDLNAKTRLRSAFTTQTEEKTWARALDLEGQSVAFAEPVAIDDLVMVSGKPVMNKSRRLEFGIERVIDNRSSVEANVFFDTTLGRGVGINSFSFDTLDEDGFDDFVANQQGSARGIRLVYSRRLNGLFSTAAGYSFGSGQRLSPSALSDPANVFENDYFHSFFAQLAADFKTGTNVRTVYRLSPEATVFAIDPFKGRLAIYDPGLSVMVTQSLPTLGLPFTAQAVVDARNLFDFQPGVTGEEGSLRLSNHRRMFRGGIQVRF
ncbi:MAG TPA: TonB-dependent receptor [Pyrinomonadaceae bacterium]|nr:TonB-dependent receptor [Pyrinomonadaceae bacterium]